MESIEQMIKRLCPEGVEWKKISEIGTIYRGVAFSKKDFTESGTPCIHYGQIYTKYGNSAHKTYTYVSKQLANGKRLAKKGDLVMAVTSENMEDVGKCLAWLGEEEILVSNHACYIRHSLNPMYLAYYLQSSHFFKYKKKISKGVKVIDLDLNMFADMLIPVPPMEIQTRIVEVLDKMTTLTAELEAELEARKQQYEYYRNKLLTFNEISDGIKFIKLGEVCKLGTGSHNTQDGLNEGLYPFYTRGIDILYLNDYDYDETAIITAGDGAGVGKVIHFVSGKYALHQRAYRIVAEEQKVLAKYVYHYMRATFYNYIMRSSVSSSVTSVRKPMLQDYPIPVPSLAEQSRIVGILDCFEALTTDLQSGLPAEIEARRQQYEYYRNKLLTFDVA